MKLSVSAYRAHASAHKKILSSGYHSQLNYGSTGAGASASSSSGLYTMETTEGITSFPKRVCSPEFNSDTDVMSPTGTSSSGQEQLGAVRKSRTKKNDDDNNSNAQSSDSKSPTQRKSRIGDGASDPDSDWTRSNQRWMKLRTTVQISSAMQKKPPLKREDSFLKRFSTRQIPETQETVEDTGSDSASGDADKSTKRRRRYLQKRRSVVNPDENFYFYWLMILTICVLYNLWTLIVRESFPELQKAVPVFWFLCDIITDVVFILDILVQLRTGYLEQGLMVYDDKKLAWHYVHSRDFFFDILALIPLDLLQLKMGTHPLLRLTRFLKVYRSVKFYYIVESRTVWPNLWRVVNLIHILLILAHWFGCFYYLLSEAEGFQGDWVYPYRPGDYATLTRKYLGSLYWSTLTLTTIGDLPTPETNAEPNFSVDGPRSIPRRGIKSRLLQFASSYGYIFTIVSYLIGVFIFATIVGQVGNVITNRNANRLEFERLLDGAKTYMRHHKVPGGMKRRVLRWYDYSWSRGRIQGGGDINTALGLLPDKLKTELALHVNLSVLKKVTIFQECQPEFLHDLVLKMKAYIFTPGDSICRKGEVAREMFIIADGILEVISETGKVLTTMKAGDFFGEIGILNLDGLNKRTADVRSVGYSELFSLSREDVLAAMKDYPEAQEILQTLGRKRLMEVRCVNKKYAKIQSEKENASYQGHHNTVHQSDSSENSASKKIVDKLRNDVKGLRNVLKISRTNRRSDESLEMQPLHNTSPKSAKTVLKRMSRVRSDEKEETAEEKEEQLDKTPSPIGAGLPLLQRLRLLKEKQDREERAVKSTPLQKSPTHSHVTCTLSPQESIQEEPERELNEGLPLIQRLQQLKTKIDPLTSEDKSMVSASVVSTIQSESDLNINNKIVTPESCNAIIPLPQMKATMKVSFKQRLQNLQLNADNSSSSKNCSKKSERNASVITKKEPPKSLDVATKSDQENCMLQKTISSTSKKIVKPSINTPSIALDMEATTLIKPWSKLKLATLISSSYTSLTNLSPESVDTQSKNFSVDNIPHMVTEKTDLASSDTNRLKFTSFRSRLKKNRKYDLKTPSIVDTKGNRTKFYQSVFDLSPEYNGLPFVKRLKILNERQKLAELEKVLQTRSFSLDSSKTSENIPISESLYRCYSDTSGIYSQFLSTYESSSTTSTNTSTSGSSKAHVNSLKSVQHDYSPLSPESNETIERCKLKSILKKLHRSKEQGDTPGSPEDLNPDRRHSKGLLRAPTLEGPPDSAKSYTHTHIHENEFGFTGPCSSKTNEFLMLSTPSSINSATPTNSAENYVSSYISATPTEYATNLYANNCNLVYPLHSESHSHSINQNSSSSIGQFPKFEDLPEGQEFFNEIICGINKVIRTQMHEMHSKFESQFSNMANEVKRRDTIIAQLEMKLKNMELKSTTPLSRKKLNSEKTNLQADDIELKIEENSSSGSSAELLFMRGDSLDTVFTSSPPIQTERNCNSPSTGISVKEPVAFASSSQMTQNSKTRPLSGKDSHAVMISEVTGNLSRLSDSVILDIGESSSSSSSEHKISIEDDDDEEEDEGNSNTTHKLPHVHHNDWEVRMLAAEMEKQERKRGHSLSVNLGDFKHCNTFLRRRRKYSETETEYSETDADDVPTTTRPRASSLDQFNLRYGIGSGIFKAMNTDRDKDKL